MNRRNSGGDGSGGGGDRGEKLDLKLHLSPPRAQIPIAESPNQSITTSPTSSCLSSELVFDETSLRYSSSPEATSMMLVGCPRFSQVVGFDLDDASLVIHSSLARVNRFSEYAR
ncbi:hypothetical protein R6Q57_028688 [Mikania cordata]